MDWHKSFSYIKSAIRIFAAAFLAAGRLHSAAVWFTVAECFGIIEEWH